MSEEPPQDPPKTPPQPPAADTPTAAEQGGNTFRAAIDPEYGPQALEKIRAAIKGNGVKSEDVELKNFEGEVFEFIAATTLKLQTKTSEKTVSGKVTGGKKLDNPQMVRDEIEKAQHKITHSPQIIGQIKELLIERPDKGLGMKAEFIKLPFLSREFVCYEPCSLCRAQGHAQCTRCRGKGYEQCPKCHGLGMEHCPQCQGNGQIPAQGGGHQPCPRCHGQKKITCGHCNQTRRIQCPICKTTGKTICKQCNGHAWNSKISMVEINAVGDFDYQREGLPAHIQNAIDSMGPKLAEHIQATPIQLEKEPEKDVVVLPYKIHVPHGDIEFSIKGASVKGYLFGTQGRLFDLPRFLEPIIAPGLKELEQAASGKDSAQSHMRKAMRYKTIRHGIIAAAKFKHEKAVKALLHSTPIGLGQSSANNIVEQAESAITSLTKRSAMIGMLAGAGLAAALCAAYFLTPVRPNLLSNIAQANIQLAADAVIFALCGAAGYFVGKSWKKSARRKVLQSLMPSKK